jgi:hypothetical protein
MSASESTDRLPNGLTLSSFASSPLRGEDNDGFAQQCRREVGVTSGNKFAALSHPHLARQVRFL